MPLDLERSVLLAAGAATLALAIATLAARPGARVNRALSALLAVRGASLLLPQASDNPAWVRTALEVQPYLLFAMVPLALYCLHAFANLAGPGPRPGAGWLALGSVAALDLVYFLDHSLVQTLAFGDADVGALRAGNGVRYVAFGPLWILVGIIGPVLAYLGLRLAIQYRNEARSAHAPLLLLVAAGLILGALFDASNRLVALVALLDAPGSFQWMPWGWAVMALPLVAFGPALMAIPVLAANGRSAPGPLRRVERAVVILAAFALFSGFLRLMAPADSDVGANPLVLVLLGLWRMATPVLLGYAILRYPVPAVRSDAGDPTPVQRTTALDRPAAR